MRVNRSQAGFTLLELLLVVVLLVLFAGAAVMNLAPLWQGTALDEGVGQFESLLRFARAEAAQQGRRVQLQLAAVATDSSGTETLGTPAISNPPPIQLRWEPEPLSQPGVFVESQSTAPLARSVNELVRVETVRRLDTVPAAPLATAGTPGTDALAPAGMDQNLAGTNTETWPPIMFYPDGSSDSAVILLASTDNADSRRMLVRWNGLSGTAAHHEAQPDELPGGAMDPTGAAQPLEPASVARSALGEAAP